MLNTDTQLIDLDGAWPVNPLDLGRSLDCRSWGPKLRYCAPTSIIHSFFEEIAGKVTPFTLYGSGDFHHLNAIWLRRITTTTMRSARIPIRKLNKEYPHDRTGDLARPNSGEQ